MSPTFIQSHQEKQAISALPRSTNLVIQIPDVYEGFIKWVQDKISTGLGQDLYSKYVCVCV